MQIVNIHAVCQCNVNIHIFSGRVSFQGETAGKETENMNTEEKKIAVIGIGGVGGYIAGLLAKAYPHVTMVARGARAESIRKKGLVLHSDYKGEIAAKPERVVPIQEIWDSRIIFLSV